MPPRAFACPHCRVKLWSIERFTDRRDRPRQRIVLERNVDTFWRWFRLYAKCPACGEGVRIPEAADVVQKS